MPVHFVNDGYGWECKRCREAAAPRADADASLPRFFREGEAEDRDARLSSPSLARWKDPARRTLICPLCGAEETL